MIMCILFYLRASRSKNTWKESVKIEGRHRGYRVYKQSKYAPQNQQTKTLKISNKNEKNINANLKSKKKKKKKNAKKSYKSAPIKSCECQGIYILCIQYKIFSHGGVFACCHIRLSRYLLFCSLLLTDQTMLRPYILYTYI